MLLGVQMGCLITLVGIKKYFFAPKSQTSAMRLALYRYNPICFFVFCFYRIITAKLLMI